MRSRRADELVSSVLSAGIVNTLEPARAHAAQLRSPRFLINPTIDAMTAPIVMTISPAQ
jgi:hypothetical protein